MSYPDFNEDSGIFKTKTKHCGKKTLKYILEKRDYDILSKSLTIVKVTKLKK